MDIHTAIRSCDLVGYKKPNDPNEYLSPFVTEMKDLLKNGFKINGHVSTPIRRIWTSDAFTTTIFVTSKVVHCQSNTFFNRNWYTHHSSLFLYEWSHFFAQFFKIWFCYVTKTLVKVWAFFSHFNFLKYALESPRNQKSRAHTVLLVPSSSSSSSSMAAAKTIAFPRFIWLFNFYLLYLSLVTFQLYFLCALCLNLSYLCWNWISQ